MAAPLLRPELPDISVLRRLARDQLVHSLESVPGKKDLYLEEELMKPLDKVAGAILLKEHGVDKIFKLESGKATQGNEQRIYIVRPRLVTAKYIADHINGDRSIGVKRTYKVIFTPRKLNVCEMIFEQEGVFGHVDIDEFTLDLIPLDQDVMSMEIPEFFTSFYLENDESWIQPVAKSLVHIQTVFGIIPNIHGHGRAAKKVFELMNYMLEDSSHADNDVKDNEIGHLFIIDRDVDYVTPLCSQVSYTGLLDDTFTVECGTVELGPAVTGQDRSIKVPLTAEDEIYKRIRDSHFTTVFKFLSDTAKQLQSGYDEGHKAKSVGEIKQFVSGKLKGLKQQHKSLTIHISACEEIMKQTKNKGDFEDFLHAEHSLLENINTKETINYIEERINRQFNRMQTLRLMCLLSLTQGGIPAKEYQSLKTQFLQSEGFHYMLTFFKLKILGLLVEQEVLQPTSKKPLSKMAAMATLPKKSSFQAISRKLNLVPRSAEEIDLKHPTDMSYVYSGAYTPLSCKYIDKVMLSNESNASLEELQRFMPGKYFSSKDAKSKHGKQTHLEPPSARVILVYFLGGCTYSEISAFRFLGKLKGYTFLIATTSILNGRRLIDLVSP